MAQFDAFLKLPGIEGETADSAFKGQIELLSFSFSAHQSGSQNHGPGGGVGKVRFSDLRCSKRYDKSSVGLMLACASGQHFAEATLTCRKAGGEQEPYLIITLKSVLVSSFNAGGSSWKDTPVMDEFSLNYGGIQKEYKVQTDKGTLGSPVKGGWNLKQNCKA
jgi:type VI secretion system secreted protein Hcp